MRRVFDKGYTPNWTEEVFVIDKLLPMKPVTYRIVDSLDEKIEGSFYEKHSNCFHILRMSECTWSWTTLIYIGSRFLFSAKQQTREHGAFGVMTTVLGHAMLQVTNVIRAHQVVRHRGGQRLDQFLNEFLQGRLSFLVLGGLRDRHALLQHFLFHIPLIPIFLKNRQGVPFLHHHHVVFRKGVQPHRDHVTNRTRRW